MLDHFEKNVFINCPFDNQYADLIRSLLFTVVHIGFNPRIASERIDSAENRLTKICELIKNSKYSIHDISRLQAKEKKEFYRLNMPFELGIDYGCRIFSANHLKDKKCLILEAEKYRYKQAFSDISGFDIKNHFEEPQTLIREVRNWFIETVGLVNIPSANIIWTSFLDFMVDFYDKRISEGYSNEDLIRMPVPEFIIFIREWLNKDPIA